MNKMFYFIIQVVFTLLYVNKLTFLLLLYYFMFQFQILDLVKFCQLLMVIHHHEMLDFSAIIQIIGK